MHAFPSIRQASVYAAIVVIAAICVPEPPLLRASDMAKDVHDKCYGLESPASRLCGA